MLDIKQIEETLKKITKWPWETYKGNTGRVYANGDLVCEVARFYEGDYTDNCTDKPVEQQNINASFIAQSPRLISKLVEAYKDVEAERDKLKRDIKSWQDISSRYEDDIATLTTQLEAEREKVKGLEADREKMLVLVAKIGAGGDNSELTANAVNVIVGLKTLLTTPRDKG